MEFTVFNIEEITNKDYFSGMEDSAFCQDFRIYDFDEDFDDVYFSRESDSLVNFLTRKFIYPNVGRLISNSLSKDSKTLGVVILFNQRLDVSNRLVRNEKYGAVTRFIGNFEINKIS